MNNKKILSGELWKEQRTLMNFSHSQYKAS